MPASGPPAPTLRDRIEASADRRRSATFVRGSGEQDRVEWSRFYSEALAAAGRLASLGMGPGAHVALLGPTTRELVTVIGAVWLGGGTVVVLPLPMRLGSVEEFVAQTRARLAGADASLVVVDPDLAAFLDDPRPGDPAVVALDELAGERAARRGRRRAQGFAPPSVDPEAIAVLQFTSGSTAEPKGVMLPHRTICANLDAIAEGAALDFSAEVLVSWLPLYHDMGLIGILGTAMTSGVELVIGAPQDFLAAPARWLEWMSAFRGTATAAPNFAFALAARALRRAAPGSLDLSAWRLAINGAEPIEPAVVEDFCAAAAPHGFDPRAVLCGFGMAEATLAVSFAEPWTGLGIDAVDRRVLETDRYAAPASGGSMAHPSLFAPGGPVRRLARLGTALAGLELRIVDPETGCAMADREVGEAQLRGTSLMAGYYKRPEATAAAFDGPWLRTGDLGYLAEGELVLCGRMKDVIIVGGRNVFPEDVELAAASVEGVRAGNVIAFGVERKAGREGIVVVAETRHTREEVGAVREAVAERVRSAVGLPPEVVLVAPGSLPKTSSGKLQRALCRARYLEAELRLA